MTPLYMFFIYNLRTLNPDRYLKPKDYGELEHGTDYSKKEEIEDFAL